MTTSLSRLAALTTAVVLGTAVAFAATGSAALAADNASTSAVTAAPAATNGAKEKPAATPEKAAPAKPAAAPAKPAAETKPAPMMKKGIAPAAKKPMAMKKAMKKPGYSRHTVILVQEGLVNHGATLDLDGYMGPKTRAALKKYQAENHLKATGAINPATLKSLHIR